MNIRVKTALNLALMVVVSLSVPSVSALTASGRVSGPENTAIAGAMVTLKHGEPEHAVTVYTDAQGHFRLPDLPLAGPYGVEVRRIGWKDLELDNQQLVVDGPMLELQMQKETDPALVAAQLPSNQWYNLILSSIDNPEHREELVRTCTYCHQQGSAATRKQRSDEEWRKVLALMARMGAGVSDELKKQIPDLFNTAYDPKTAVAKLTEAMDEPGFAPPPDAAVQRAVVEEWVLGHPASMQHDVAVHPDGSLYSVDMMQDSLYRLDPSTPTGTQEVYPIPRGDVPFGGVFGSDGSPAVPNANAHVGPHSLQVADDGSIWVTLALGNLLGRFDPADKTWQMFPLEEGLYPHTLRIDQKGRIWYTLAASNHVGVYDPANGKHDWIRVPALSMGQEVQLRMLPFFVWLSRHVDLGDMASGEGLPFPVPYGIDVAPNGDIWFSQLNAHRIGRIDPETHEVEVVDTPFTAPRRMRFDSKGMLWIPGFSSGLISRFDPVTREFKSWPIPIEPLGSDTPYALNVDLRSDTVWICGTNSDTLISFEIATENFTVYPLPTRVTYTREIDFDDQGRIWTSNSNAPAWQIEGLLPRVIRLDPDAFPAPAVVAVTTGD